MRWPEGPPHLALNPPYLFLLFFFWFFYKKTSFSPRKGHFLFIFSVSLSFSLSLFWPPSFSVFFLCLFFSSFLSLFLFVFPFCFHLVPCFCLFFFLSSLLFFHERNHIKILNCKFCLHQYVFFFGFLFFRFKFFFSYLCSFLILSYVFLFNIKVFDFQTNNKKNKNNFGQKGDCNKMVFFFYQPVFWKMSKVLVFFGPFFWQFLGDVQKHYKIGISAHFEEQKIEKMAIFNSY